MQNFFAELNSWASTNYMRVNYVKTKEMTLGHVIRSPLASLVVEGNQIDRVPVLSCLESTLIMTSTGTPTLMHF